MDFSSFVASFDESSDRIFFNKPIPKKQVSYFSKQVSPRYSTPKKMNDFAGLEIFYINPLKQKPSPKLASVGHERVYDHVYKENKLFEETLRYHKDLKCIEPIKTQMAKFADNGKFFKIKRADFRRLRLEYEHKRSETAIIGRDLAVKTREAAKDIKLIRRELIPQTKACSGSKCKSPCSNLLVQGTGKDFFVRKL